MKIPKTIQIAGMLQLACGCLHAADYYVAPSGNDTSGTGSLAAPFRTIQKAADVAVAGDNVIIRAGTYRETITPTNSGTSGARITYKNYNNEVVTISGADVISPGSWSLDSGSTYQAPLAASFFTSTFNQALQVFVDGEMVTLAKWPNVTTKTNAYPSGIAPPVDISHPAKAVTTSFISKTRDEVAKLTTGVVADTSLPPKPAGFYDGAEIYFQPNNQAWSWIFNGVVTNVPANSNQITFTSRSGAGKDFNQGVYDPESRYYLFNKKEFLDSPGEWWHDRSNNRLYLWTPNSASPATNVVEVKKREFAFDLSDRSHITVQGLRLFACSITSDIESGGSALGFDSDGNTIYPWRNNLYLSPSTGIVIDGIHAQYLNHFTDVSGHFFLQWGTCTGIVLSGTGHTIRNSIIEKTAGNGIELLGNGHTVFNNFISDIAYGGTDASAVNTTGSRFGTDHVVSYNTIRRTGRSGITPRSHANSNAAGGQFIARYHHNDISYFGLQDWDVGGFYAAAGDSKFVRIDHNLISEGRGFISAGIYMDYSKNYILDHNVVWNVEWGIKVQGHYNNENNTLVYNNTASVRNLSSTPFGPFAIGNSSGNNNGTVLRNNILSCNTPPAANGYQSIGNGASAFSGAEIGSNLAWDGITNSATDPKFINRATTLDATGVDYSLLSGSAAIDAGVVIGSYTRNGITVPPFADATTGSGPDAGAYEFGVTPWIAGANLARCAEPVPSPPAGSYASSVNVTLTTATSGASIRYTIDGSTPTSTSGMIYVGPISVPTSLTIKALAYKIGVVDSNTTVATYTITSPPAVPSGLAATANSFSQITLTWTDNAANESGFKLERSADGTSGWSQIATTPSNTTTYIDSGLTASTTHYYRVRATNAYGDSLYTAVASATTPAAVDVTSGLAARLAFDETSGTSAADSTGNNHTGTLQSGASFAAGKINNGVSLNGTSGYVAMPLVFNPAVQTNFTVTAWVRLDDVGSGSPTIIQQQDGSGIGRSWLYRNPSGRLATFLGGSETASTATLAIGGWYHVALIKTGSSLQLYVNGAPNGSPTTRTMESCVGAMRIGAHKTTTNQYWNGMIDEVRFYDRALSGIELANVAAFIPSVGTALQTFRTTHALASNGSQDALTPAGDDVPNLTKYAFNMIGSGTDQKLDLNTPNSSVVSPSGVAGLPLIGVESGTGKLQITFIRRKALGSPAPGITYTVQFSEDLITWTEDGSASESATNIDTVFERVTVTDSTTNPLRKFVRVKISAP